APLPLNIEPKPESRGEPRIAADLYAWRPRGERQSGVQEGALCAPMAAAATTHLFAADLLRDVALPANEYWMILDRLSLDALRGSRPGTIGEADEKAHTQLSYATAATWHTSWSGRASGRWPTVCVMRSRLANSPR
ncbi:MAG: hypothetical protein ACRDOK_09785, partial [Streptosporangiaceae bacterium]